MKYVGGTGSDRHVGVLTGCCFTHFNMVGKKNKTKCASLAAPCIQKCTSTASVFKLYLNESAKKG